MLLPVAALALQASTSPFFSNDAAGFARVFGLVVSVLLPVLALVYKLSFNTHNEKLGELQRDVNGFGEKVNAMALEQRGCETKVSTLEQANIRMDGALQGVKLAQAELRTQVAAMATNQVELQRDIMQAITHGNNTLNQSTTELKVEVARLDERGKFNETMANLTEVLRELRQPQR